MQTAPTPRGCTPWVMAASAVLALALFPPGTGAAASAPDPSSAIAPAEVAAGEAATFVGARDAYERAQSLYRSADFARALSKVDGALRSLNYVLTHSEDSSVRRAAGDLLRRLASLRLSCTRGLEKEKQQLQLVGPPSPTAIRLTPPARASAAPPAEPVDPSAAANGEAAAAEPLLQAAPDGVEAGPEAPGATSLDAAVPAPDIDPVENGRVQKWVDFYTGRGRATFEKWLKRSGLYMEWMKGILKDEGLPTDLVHLVFVESGFNPNARSRSHAVGPWQFIRGTAKLFGLKVDSWIDERRDPERATLAAARYLKHLYALFESWPLALASYNAGEGTIVKAISRQGTNDFWQLNLPQQTREYVPQFLACLSIAREPERYGFDSVEREAPLAFDTVQLPGPVDLNAIAAACGASVETLRLLNPALLRHAAPTDKAGLVTLRVPPGAGEGLLGGLRAGTISLPEVRTPPDPPYARHKVRRGESLAAIARRYGVAVDELARANRISTRAHLRRGRVLRVPVGEPSAALPLSRSAPAFKPAAPKPAEGAGGTGTGHLYGGTRTVRIQRGETLGTIAERYGTDVRTLRALNGLRPRQPIKAGARLRVPVDSEG